MHKNRIARFLIAAFFIISHTTSAQLTDDFSDGNFTSNPSWFSSNVSGGDDFTIINETLRSDGPSSTATIWISTSANPDINGGITTWSFTTTYQNAPSGSNNLRVYLMSDQEDLTATTQGYYIQLGESGTDDGIDLYKTGTTTPIIEDFQSLVSSVIEVNVKVTRTEAGEWTLEADPSGGTNYITIGTATDTEYTSSNYFGFLVNHTSTRNQAFYFDDVEISSTAGPPQINDIAIISDSQIDISFSESLNITSAEQVANYSVDQNIGSPISATLDNTDHKLVHLDFSTSFSNATQYQLSVNNVEDLSGDAISNATTSFYFFIQQPAAYKGMIINEIYADPSESNGLPDGEYIELYNASGETFDLKNWTFSDTNTTGIISDQYFLQPEEYLILCSVDDEGDFTSYGNTYGLVTWPTLNNGGDVLVIYDNYGNLIDSLAYDSDWYGDAQKSSGGWSLELIDPGNWCGAADNWTASIAALGGTPGTVNSTYNDHYDSKPPEVEHTQVVNAHTVMVKFNEPVDTTSLSSTNFTVDPDNEVASINILDKYSFQLILSSSLTANETYALTISNVSDCSGNLLTAQTVEVIFVRGDQPVYKDVIINEIFADPSPPNDLPEVEFVEIFNRSNKVFVLEDWTFSDEATEVFFTYQHLFPGEYLILAPSEEGLAYNDFGKTSVFDSWPSLNNGGDALMIKDSLGNIIDSIAYTDRWYKSTTKKEGGWTLELIDPDNECGEEENWTSAEDFSGGTPGRQNSVYNQNPDLVGPELLQAVAASPDSIWLYFDEKLDPESVTQANINFEPDIKILRKKLLPTLRRILIIPEKAVAPGTEYKVVVNNLLDCSGNNIGDLNTKNFGLIQPADSLDLIINEVLFNPRPGGEDFVELYNKSNKYINLKQWKIASAETDVDSIQVKSKKDISKSSLILEPQQYLVLTADDLVLKDQYPLSHEDRFKTLNSLPSYPNEEGVVVLLNPENMPFDYFHYSEDFHSVLLDRVEGISLERVSFEAPTNQKDNWKSAVAAVGFATPGYENSSSRSNVNPDGIITIDPKVIIPDGSGKQEFATINYSFDQTGNAATVTILDMQGRTIKELAHNDFVGTQGFYTWDGTDENGRKAKMGYYIVMFEMFRADGSTEILKEKVVVGNRF